MSYILPFEKVKTRQHENCPLHKHFVRAPEKLEMQNLHKNMLTGSCSHAWHQEGVNGRQGHLLLYWRLTLNGESVSIERDL